MTFQTCSRPSGRVSTTLAAAIGVLLATAAGAQTPPVDAGAIEEVVVTAQKRSESLQSVPVSVTALTSSQLGELKIDSPSDLATQIPNLQVNGIVGEGSPLFSLRGVSMFDYSLNQSSPVASYIDEVYKGNFVLFGVEMYDLERVEVLRGPQGTLYGKNTTGGAINFITRKPGFDTEAEIKIGAGNYGRQEVEGAFQAGLVPDRVAIRAAFTYTKVDGFIHNVLPGPSMEGVDQYGARISLLFKASDDVDLSLRYSMSRQNPYNYAIIDGSIAPPNPAAGPYAAGGVGFTGYFRTVDGTATGQPLANDEIAQVYTPKRHQSNDALALTADWKVSAALKLTSITSWDQGSLFNPEGTDGAPYYIWKIPYTGNTHQITQDLRLTTTDDGAFSYIVGAYYQHETIFNSTENQIFTDPAFNTFNDYNDCLANSGAGYAAGVYINLGCIYHNQFDQIRNSWAAYSDGSYKLSDTVKLRAGLRYNHDNGNQKNALDQARGSDGVPIANILVGTVNGVPVLTPPGTPNYEALVNATTSQALHNTAFTGRLGVDYTPTRDSLLYLSYSRGYRSAAFNAQFLFSPSDFTTVEPETLDSYEAGFKSAWLENRLQFNGALFHYQYKNQQFIDVWITGQQPLINLPKSKIDGAEFELVTRPVRSFTLRLGLGILDTKIQEALIHTNDPTDPTGLQDVSGNKLPYAPSVSGTFGADWDAANFGSTGLRLHLDGTYASKQYFELRNEERIAQDAYTLLNARIMLRGDGGKWELGAWGRNLTDKFYLTNAVDVQGFGFDYRHRGLPRMYGFDASYHF